MKKRQKVIEILIEEYEKQLENFTLLELNRILAEIENSKMSF